MQCNYCCRKFSCANESRPGVTCAVLDPATAVSYVREYVKRAPHLRVVGIAGPGDPFANPDETLETFRLVRKELPQIQLCVATNGLNLPAYVGDLAAMGVSHVTITVNAVDPKIGMHIYRWMYWDGAMYEGEDAAAHLWWQQREALRRLKEHDAKVKINSIYIPGINDHHIIEVAREASRLGADIFNVLPLYPVAGTPFENIAEPLNTEVEALRKKAVRYLPQMSHCQRCRADAVGTLEETGTIQQIFPLQPVQEDSLNHPVQDEARGAGVFNPSYA